MVGISRTCNPFKAIPMPKFRGMFKGITIQYKCRSERTEIIQSVVMHRDNTTEQPTTQSKASKKSSNNIVISKQNWDDLVKLQNEYKGYKNNPNKSMSKQNATNFVTQVRVLRSNSEINRIFKSRCAMAHHLTSIESHAERLCTIIDALNTILEKQSQTTTNPTTTISSDTNHKNQVQHPPAQTPSIRQQSRVWSSNSQGHSGQNTQNEAETQNTSTNSSKIPQTTKHHDNTLQTHPQKPQYDDKKNLPFELKSISDGSGEANATPPPLFSNRPTDHIHLSDAIEPTQPLKSTQYNGYTTPASMLPNKFVWINNLNYNGPNSTTPTDEKKIQNTTPDSSDMAEDVVKETINTLTGAFNDVTDEAIAAAEGLASTVSNGMQEVSNGLEDFSNAVSNWWANISS
ncbi:MAG: hypothetical protein QG673_759 [Pseudomonadota bacterium]|nr:hypothetical protein [Pseudomonadota bacterium]